MNKWFKTLGLVAALSLFGGVAQAEFGFITDSATVDDVTTTACTAARNGTVSGFGGGVDMDQVWQLEVEVGSPGSGAFAPVPGFTDVFPTVVGATATGGPTQIMRYASEAVSCFRLRMTTDGGGTAQIALITDRDSPTAYPGVATHYRIFDDFHTGIQPILAVHAGIGSYLTFRGSDGQAIEPLIVANPEGTVGLTSGDNNDDTDLAVGSYGLAGQGALVSDGLVVVEFRIHMGGLTHAVGVGLADTVANATEMEPFEADGSNVISEGTVTSCQNCIAFLAHTTDTNTFGWLAVSMNANTMGAAADEYTLGIAPVATTYQILRIEIDATGDAYWYINGVLRGVESLAVATTAVIFPYYWAGSVAATAVNLVLIDYIDFWAPRPTG